MMNKLMNKKTCLLFRAIGSHQHGVAKTPLLSWTVVLMFPTMVNVTIVIFRKGQPTLEKSPI